MIPNLYFRKKNICLCFDNIIKIFSSLHMCFSFSSSSKVKLFLGLVWFLKKCNSTISMANRFHVRCTMMFISGPQNSPWSLYAAINVERQHFQAEYNHWAPLFGTCPILVFESEFDNSHLFFMCSFGQVSIEMNVDIVSYWIPNYTTFSPIWLSCRFISFGLTSGKLLMSHSFITKVVYIAHVLWLTCLIWCFSYLLCIELFSS